MGLAVEGDHGVAQTFCRHIKSAHARIDVDHERLVNRADCREEAIDSGDTGPCTINLIRLEIVRMFSGRADSIASGMR